MCYIIYAKNEICLPIEGMLGESQVIQRAIALLNEFPKIKLYKECCDGQTIRYKEVKEFARQVEERVKTHRTIVKQRRRLTYMNATPVFP